MHHGAPRGHPHELDQLGHRLQPLVSRQWGARALRQRKRRKVRQDKCNLSPIEEMFGDIQSLLQWHFINVYV